MVEVFAHHHCPGDIRILLIMQIMLSLVSFVLRSLFFIKNSFPITLVVLAVFFRFSRLCTTTSSRNPGLKYNLINVGLNLRGEEVGEAEVEGVLQSEVSREGVGTVTLEHSDVLLLTVADVHRNRQQLGHLLVTVVVVVLVIFLLIFFLLWHDIYLGLS